MGSDPLVGDEYWANQFDITQDDLKRIIERLERHGVPQDLKSIALRLIRGRLEHGHDFSSTVLQEWTGKTNVRLWDPEGEWQLGDIAIIPLRPNDSENYEPFLGEVIYIDLTTVKFKVEGFSYQPSFVRCSPTDPEKGKHSPEQWRNFIRDLVQEKYNSVDLNQISEGVFLRHGARILNRLTSIMQADPRFVEFKGKWFIKKSLPAITESSIQEIYRALLQRPESSLEEIAEIVLPKNYEADKTLWHMAIHLSLQRFPEKFENRGTSSYPNWCVKHPQPSQAKAIYYVYDPETFEILCCPEQELSIQKAHRLQDLGLYNKVVEFAK